MSKKTKRENRNPNCITSNIVEIVKYNETIKLDEEFYYSYMAFNGVFFCGIIAVKFVNRTLLLFFFSIYKYKKLLNSNIHDDRTLQIRLSKINCCFKNFCK